MEFTTRQSFCFSAKLREFETSVHLLLRTTWIYYFYYSTTQQLTKGKFTPFGSLVLFGLLPLHLLHFVFCILKT